MYLSDVSGNMHKIELPFGADLATFKAPLNVAPPEIPVKIPSLDAKSFAHCMASGPSIGINSSFMSIPDSRTSGMKSGVHPWTGCGVNAGCDATGAPDGFLSVFVPDANNGAADGSNKQIFTSGLFAYNAFETP